MKKFLLIIFVFITYSVHGTTITVSNDINRPAQYSNLQTAIDAAANGDTLLIYGSSTSYGNAELIKPLVLIGESYNNTVGNTAYINTLYLKRFSSTLSSSNSTIMGLEFSAIYFDANFANSTDGQRTLDNIVVMRCKMRGIRIGSGALDAYNNINFINTIFYENTYFQYLNTTVDVTFSNSIFDGVVFHGNINRDTNGVITSYLNLSNVKFLNNLFLNSTSGLLNDTYGILFENNIFFGHELFYDDYEAITWNHNMFYLVDQTTTVGLTTNNNNTGSGNQTDTDPLFVNYPSTPTAFSYNHDYHLQADSPALTASLQGTEIGIYGGSYPYEVGAAPPVPVVTEITITDGTSSVPVGGTVNFNFKAESGN